MKNAPTRKLFAVIGAVSMLAGSALAVPRTHVTPLGQTKKPASKRIVKKSGLIIEELKIGTGKVAKTGNRVSVHYLGKLTNGRKFDSSYDRKEPFTFTLGAGEVIKGWDEGVAGMKVGGKRKLIIPAKLGYGASGAGGVIPPNATLVFEVALLKIG